MDIIRKPIQPSPGAGPVNNLASICRIGRKAIDTPDNPKNVGQGLLWEAHQRERPRVSIKLRPNSAAKMTSALPRPRVIRLRVDFAATRSVDTVGEPYSSRTRPHAISTQIRAASSATRTQKSSGVIFPRDRTVRNRKTAIATNANHNPIGSKRSRCICEASQNAIIPPTTSVQKANSVIQKIGLSTSGSKPAKY